MNAPRRAADRATYLVCALLVALSGCAHRPSQQLTSLCGVAPVDTKGWRQLTDRTGTFAILLPADAVQQADQFLQAYTGVIEVGAMQIAFRIGRGNSDVIPPESNELPRNRGDTVLAEPGDVDIVRCGFKTGVRDVKVLSARIHLTPSDTIPDAPMDTLKPGGIVEGDSVKRSALKEIQRFYKEREYARLRSQNGQYVVRAGVPTLPSVGGVYFTMHNGNPAHRATFLTALQTIRILYPDRVFPRGDGKR